MFFKSFVSRNQSKNGDNIWISVCGNLSVIIDAVSISRNPELTNKFIIEFLNELENYFSEEESERILRTIIDWGRYAEILAYDYDSGELSLENPQ